MKFLYKLLFILVFFSCSESDDVVSDPEFGFRVPESEISSNKLIITTENKQPVISKTEELKATVLVESSEDKKIITSDIKIRGRGNSTWGMPKKPYQIEFDDKEKVFGMPKDKKWILLANFSDKTMLRNSVGFQLGNMSTLAWTPKSKYTEVFVNDQYMGVYQVSQKVEATSNRVDLGDEGFLLEVDQQSRLNADDVYFRTSNFLFNIKEPKLSFNDDQFNLIKDFITEAENALLSADFSNPEKGYLKYFDLDSFVDFYLINEITKNQDANFFSSVFMNYKPGEKLKMGPIWDFDISLGNINYSGNEDPKGFYIKTGRVWYPRLFQDPVFVEKVKSRFNYFYQNKNKIFEKIDADALMLEESQRRNFQRWPILGKLVWPNFVTFPTYQEEVDYLKTWLDKRFEWLNTEINKL